MKIVNTGKTYMIYSDDLKTYDQLPVGTYTVCFHQMRGFWLEKQDNIELTEKIYGVHESKAEKILKSFSLNDRNLGVILSGNKGIGKSLTAKLMAQKAVEKYNYPVIIVDQCINGVAKYISEIKQECVVLFDEFDKTYKSNSGRNNESNDSDQDEFLTLFDGLDQGKKLFIVTCNRLSDLSDYLVNRPGRFHYHLRFDYPSVDEIKEYLKDKLQPKYYNKEIEDIIRFSNMTDLNYDCLRAIAFELNQGIPFNEAIKDLNITNYDNDYRYDAICILDNGMRSIRKNVNCDLSRSSLYLGFSFPQLKDSVYITVDPTLAKYDFEHSCDVCDEKSFTNVQWNNGESTNKINPSSSTGWYESDDECYDDEPECCEDCDEENNPNKNKKMPAVVAIMLKRKSSYRNIHYAI